MVGWTHVGDGDNITQTLVTATSATVGVPQRGFTTYYVSDGTATDLAADRGAVKCFTLQSVLTSNSSDRTVEVKEPEAAVAPGELFAGVLLKDTTSLDYYPCQFWGRAEALIEATVAVTEGVAVGTIEGAAGSALDDTTPVRVVGYMQETISADGLGTVFLMGN